MVLKDSFYGEESVEEIKAFLVKACKAGLTVTVGLACAVKGGIWEGCDVTADTDKDIVVIEGWCAGEPSDVGYYKGEEVWWCGEGTNFERDCDYWDDTLEALFAEY